MDHVRIDEGVSRSQSPAPWPARKPPIAGKLGKNFKPDKVLIRYLHGEEIADIADSLGVHPKALNYHLLKEEFREAWRKAQVAVSQAELQEAKAVIRSAPDALSLSRAREALRSAQWDLERLESRLYGQKQELTITDKTDLGDRLRRARERTIEGEVQRITDVMSNTSTDKNQALIEGPIQPKTET
jgi:hypothetical protein